MHTFEKNLDEAVKWYRKSVFESDGPVAHLGLGRVYYEGGSTVKKDMRHVGRCDGPARFRHASGRRHRGLERDDDLVAVASDKYGIGAGHWRRNVATGNAPITYLGPLWRSVLTRIHGAANEAAPDFDMGIRAPFACRMRARRPAARRLDPASMRDGDCTFFPNRYEN